MTADRDKFEMEDGRAVDHLLGEGSAEERAAFRRDVEVDPTAAVDFAATKLLLDELRELGTDVGPSAAFGARVRAMQLQHRRSVERRARRREPNPWPVLWAAAAVLLVTLGVRLFPQPAPRANTDVQGVDLEALPPKLPRLDQQDTGVVVAEGGAAAWATEIEGVPTALPMPVEQDRKFHEMVARLVRTYPAPDTFSQWVSADNQLAMLRMEFRNRFTPTARKRALALSGGRPELDGRVQALAASVAARIDADLQDGTASVRDTALSLRALLASGSDTRMGRHRAVARRCAAWLEARVSGSGGDDALSDEDSAMALAALSDIAVCVGRYGELVRSGVEALAVRTVSAADAGRPGLLHWRVSPHALGDAGRVFRLAPAFGVRTSLAYRARMLVAAHMEERLAAGRDDRPELLAAQRYGFDDLVDRDSLDQKLRLWRASYLKPDYVAMHHLAWSQYPVRPGWSRFQRELRGLATLATPESVGDASALLLCLAMNFAAPGVSELVGTER